MATTRPITTFFQPVKSSTVKLKMKQLTTKKLKLRPWNLKTVSCFMLLFHFLRSVSDYGLEVNICTFVVLLPKSQWKVQFQVMLLYLPTQIRFLIGGELVMCHWSKLNDALALGRTKLNDALGQQHRDLELSTCT